jgi:hypothetical protein
MSSWSTFLCNLKGQWGKLDLNENFQFCDIFSKKTEQNEETITKIKEENFRNFIKLANQIDSTKILHLTKHVHHRHVLQPLWPMKMMRYYELGPVDTCIYNALCEVLYQNWTKVRMTDKYQYFDCNTNEQNLNKKINDELNRLDEVKFKYIFRFNITDFYTNIYQYHLRM